MPITCIIDYKNDPPQCIPATEDMRLSDYRRLCQRKFKCDPQASYHLWDEKEPVREDGRFMKDLTRESGFVGAAAFSFTLRPDVYDVRAPWGQGNICLDIEDPIASLLAQLCNELQHAGVEREERLELAAVQIETLSLSDQKDAPANMKRHSRSYYHGYALCTPRFNRAGNIQGWKVLNSHESLLDQKVLPDAVLRVRRKLDWPAAITLGGLVFLFGYLIAQSVTSCFSQ